MCSLSVVFGFEHPKIAVFSTHYGIFKKENRKDNS